jgi:hypothetical protein
MTRKDMATGQKQDEEAICWSETYDNFQATDLNDLYEIMKDKVLDAFATFLDKGNSWRFRGQKSNCSH